MRCSWVNLNSQLYIKYHDEEWGVPVYEDNKLFEMLVLESFQAGLSWLTILNKREHFRSAFDNFDYRKISLYSDDKIKELMENKNIIRCKSKIIATIKNAQIFLEIQKEFGSFSKYIWKFNDNKIFNNGSFPYPTQNILSDTVSKDLKKRGMKYVGSTIIYSYLQAIGIINDHEPNCECYRNDKNL